MSTADAKGTAERPGTTAVGAFLIAILVLVPRVIEAATKSLWLDELHTTFVARAESIGETIARILPDVHAPLYFLAVHFAGAGNAHAARALSILAAIATAIVLDRIAATAGFSRTARIVTAVAFAFLPYQIQYGAELRPYAWLELAATVAVYAAFAPHLTKTRAFTLLTAAFAFGFYSHYLTAIVVLAIGAVRLVHRPRGFPWILGAGVLGVLLFLPWVYYDEHWIFTNPRVMIEDEKAAAPTSLPTSAPAPSPKQPTPYGLVVKEVVSAAPRLVAPMGKALGGWQAVVAMLAAGLFAATVGVGLFDSMRGACARSRERLSIVAVTAVAVIALALMVALSFLLWRRIAVQYLIVGAWIIPLLAGRAADAVLARRSRRLAAAGVTLMILGLIAAGLAHALGRPRENIRDAVAEAVARGAAENALLTAVMRQPAHYSNLEAFRVYAPAAPAIEPANAPALDAADGDRPIYVVTRGFHWTADDAPETTWKTLAAGRTIEVVRRFDDAITLFRLVRRRE